MEKYERYKDSGVEWIGEIPEQWEVKRLKWTARFEYGDSLAVSDRQDGVIPVFGSNGTAGFHDTAITKSPCIIIGRKGSFGKVNWSDKACFPIDTTYFIDEMKTDSNLRWLFYLLQNLGLDLLSRDTGVPGLNREDAYQNSVPLPPDVEQTAIANYLDKKTAQIDKLVANKQKLIELLKEERTAIINQAVTKGIDPDVKLKPSGIEWLGDIPAHWKVKKLKRITTTITNGYVGPTRDILVSDGIKYIQSLHIKANTIKFDFPYYVDKAWSDKHPRSILKEKDILVVQTGAGTGNTGMVPKEFEGCNCHALIIVRIDPQKSLPNFIMNVLTSTFGKDTLKSIETGALHPHLNSTKICDIEIPIPPFDEQEAVVQHISFQSCRIERIVSKIEKEIELLQEYRTALISEVVTGKIRVNHV